MAKNAGGSKFGVWAFIIGVILALIGGILVGLLGAGQTIVTSVLIILGLIVGFVNVTDKESKDYLMAAVVLVIVAYFGGATFSAVPAVGLYLQNVLNAILTFVIPATIIVSLKAIYALARD
jgi:hypothetical protein